MSLVARLEIVGKDLKLIEEVTGLPIPEEFPLSRIIIPNRFAKSAIYIKDDYAAGKCIHESGEELQLRYYWRFGPVIRVEVILNDSYGRHRALSHEKYTFRVRIQDFESNDREEVERRLISMPRLIRRDDMLSVYPDYSGDFCYSKLRLDTIFDEDVQSIRIEGRTGSVTITHSDFISTYKNATGVVIDLSEAGSLRDTTYVSIALFMKNGETIGAKPIKIDRGIVNRDKTDRETCLLLAKECVCGQREQDYGTPEDNFGTIARLWSEYLGKEITPVDVAMMMALLKTARIKNGGGTEDSFVDLAGYAACAYEIFRKGKDETT